MARQGITQAHIKASQGVWDPSTSTFVGPEGNPIGSWGGYGKAVGDFAYKNAPTALSLFAGPFGLGPQTAATLVNAVYPNTVATTPVTQLVADLAKGG